MSNGVAVKVYADGVDVLYDYEIVHEGDGFRIWCSTGPLSGKFVSPSFDSQVDALQALVDFIRDGEDA